MLDLSKIQLYIVHMKRMTASEARRRWFEILDRAVAGEEIVVARKGSRVVIRREEEPAGRGEIPDYGDLIRVPEPEEAHTWRWSWPGPGQDLSLEDDGS